MKKPLKKKAPTKEEEIEAAQQVVDMLTSKSQLHRDELAWLELQQNKYGRFIVIVNDLYTATVEGKEQNIKLRDHTEVKYVSEKVARQLCKLNVFGHKDASGKVIGRRPARGYMPFKQFHSIELERSDIALAEYKKRLEALQNG